MTCVYDDDCRLGYEYALELARYERDLARDAVEEERERSRSWAEQIRGEIGSSVTSLRDELAAAQADRDEQKVRVGELCNENASLLLRLNAATSRQNAEIADLQKQVESKRVHATNLSQRLTEAEEKLSRLTVNEEAVRERLADNLDKVTELQKQVESKQRLAEDAAEVGMAAALSTSNSGLRKEVESLQRTNADLSEVVAETERKLHEQTKVSNQLAEETERLGEQLAAEIVRAKNLSALCTDRKEHIENSYRLVGENLDLRNQLDAETALRKETEDKLATETATSYRFMQEADRLATKLSETESAEDIAQENTTLHRELDTANARRKDAEQRFKKKADDVAALWCDIRTLETKLKAAESTQPISDSLRLIAEERARQVAKWPSAHDDEHTKGELALASACHAAPVPLYRVTGNMVESAWPWTTRWSRLPEPPVGSPSGDERIRELSVAGALIVAEIDRLKRAEKQSPTEDGVCGLVQSPKGKANG